MFEIVDFGKLLFVVANLCNLPFFCEKTCKHGHDLCFNPILLKIDIHVCFMMMHVQKDWFSSKLLLVVANLCNLRYCANKFVCTVLTDLLTQFCWKLICMYVLRWFMSERVIFSKIVLVVANLCNLQFFANKLVSTVTTCVSTRLC